MIHPLPTLLFLMILWIAGRVGGMALRRLAPAQSGLSVGEKNLFSIAIGFAWLSLSILGFGLAGFLNLFYILPWISFSFLLTFLDAGNAFQPFSFSKSIGKNWLGVAAAAAPLFISWAMAQAPPISNDVLAYHLADPQLFIEAQKIYPIPGSRESTWPYFMEMLYTLGLLLHGPALAQLFHWAFYGLTAAALYLSARRFYEPLVGWIAALVFLYTPLVFSQAGCAYADLAMAFYAYLSLFAMLLAPRLREVRAAILSGIFCGAALSIKYLALGVAAVMAALWLFAFWRVKKAFFLFLTAIFLTAGAWYLRNWVLMGNPFYPFFHNYFGGHGYWVQIRESEPLGKDLFSFLALGWNLTLHPDRYGGEKLGPLYLIFLPFLLLFVRKSSSHGRLAALFAIFYGAFVFIVCQHTRFFLPTVAVAALGVGIAAHWLLQRGIWMKRLVWLVFAGFIFLHGALFIYKSRHGWPVLLGQKSTADYLLAHERSWKGYQFFKQNASPDATVFNADEARRFYNPLPNMVFETGPLLEELKQNNETFFEYLSRKKFDYLWFLDTRNPEMSQFAEKNDYHEVYTYSFQEGKTTYRFKIWQRIVN